MFTLNSMHAKNNSLLRTTKKIRVRAKPPFLRLRLGLGIYQSRHRPVIMVNSHAEYLKLSPTKLLRFHIQLLCAFTSKVQKFRPNEKSKLIIIDDEYHGKNNLVKSILISYIRKEYENFDEKLIRFSQITKNSNAHHVAIETFRGEHKPNEILTEKQIWGLLK